MRCDALPKKTFEVAAAANAHLIVQLKDNQLTLRQKVEAACNTAMPRSAVQTVDGKKRIGVRIERSQTRTLLRQQIDGSLLRLAVNAYIGDSVEPNLCGRVDRAEIGQLEPMQEILLDVANP